MIDASGQYIAPGFVDAHTHVECAMISVGEFGCAVVPHGTTAIFMDHHEICNVCGSEGVRAMLVPLPLTGLMSDLLAEHIVAKVDAGRSTQLQKFGTGGCAVTKVWYIHGSTSSGYGLCCLPRLETGRKMGKWSLCGWALSGAFRTEIGKDAD
ncbi:MAG: hypothetical protein IJ088_14930 [Clostridia bacterium]|nr:hypothetical protein [Clostridia bacterium]